MNRSCLILLTAILCGWPAASYANITIHSDTRGSCRETFTPDGGFTVGGRAGEDFVNGAMLPDGTWGLALRMTYFVYHVNGSVTTCTEVVEWSETNSGLPLQGPSTAPAAPPSTWDAIRNSLYRLYGRLRRYVRESGKREGDFILRPPAPAAGGVRGSRGIFLLEHSPAFASFDADVDAAAGPLSLPFVVTSAGEGDWLEIASGADVFFRAPLTNFEPGALYFADVPVGLLGEPAMLTFYLNSVGAADSEVYFPTALIECTEPGEGGTPGACEPDETAPSLVPQLSSSANAAGWHNQDVTVTWNVQDAESGIQRSTGCEPTTLASDTAGVTIVCEATNGAGLSASNSIFVRLDKTAPQVQVVRTPANGSGWNNGPVAVTFTCDDPLSGVVACPPAVTLTTDGINQSVTGEAVDAAGNRTVATVGGINIDRTPPEARIQFDPSAGAVVVVPTDTLSGIQSHAHVPGAVRKTGFAGSRTERHVHTMEDAAGNSIAIDLELRIAEISFGGSTGRATEATVVGVRTGQASWIAPPRNRLDLAWAMKKGRLLGLLQHAGLGANWQTGSVSASYDRAANETHILKLLPPPVTLERRAGLTVLRLIVRTSGVSIDY